MSYYVCQIGPILLVSVLLGLGVWVREETQMCRPLEG
jgi:hypothetical protein